MQVQIRPRRMMTDIIAELMENSESSTTVSTSGVHGYPRTQLYSFNLLSGEKVVLMRTLEAPLEPEQDEELELEEWGPEQAEPEERGAYRRPEET